MKKSKRVIIIIILCSMALWLLIGFIDYSRVCRSFEKPIFSRPAVTVDDGGSGIYKGIGYSFEIEGNFMPEDVLPGVTYFEYSVFGTVVKSGIRD